MGVEQPSEAPAMVETIMTEDAVSAAPAAPLQPPVPSLAQDPWVQPEIVDAPAMPSADLVAELPASEPVAATQWQPPQMSDYEIVPETLAQDFSDPAQEFQSFFEAETSAAAPATPVSTDMAQPEPAPVDTSAYHVEAVLGGAAAMAGAATVSAAYQNQPQHQPELGEAGVYAADPAAVTPETYSDPAAIDMASSYDQQDDIVIPPAHVATDPFQRKRSGKRAALAIVAVALLGGTAALGWNMVSGESGPAPTLLASTEPVKVKPKDAGGKVVPNQDQAVYRSVDGSDKDAPQQARLKDDSEEPIAVTTSPVKKSETRLAAKATNGENGLILQPRRVRTVVVKPDGTIVSTTASTAPTTGGVEVPEPTLALTPTSPLPTVPATGAAEPSTKVSYSAPKADASATTTVAALAAKPLKVQPIKVTPVKVQPKPIVAAPKPVAVATPKPAAKTPVKTAAVKPAATALPSRSSPYAVQIAAQRSAGAAERSYATLLKRYGSVLRGKGVDYKQVQVKGKTYFRVRIPAQSRSAANQLCGSLKSRGGSCFVTR